MQSEAVSSVQVLEAGGCLALSEIILVRLICINFCASHVES